MKENVYDQPSFFKKYADMLRSKEGLKGAGEWTTLEKMLPDFKDKRVLDLGCGYGWHCWYASEKGALSVLGIDLSDKMLKEAQKKNGSPKIEYRCMGIEDFDYPVASYDIVISSLALHYLEDLSDLFQKVQQTLRPAGAFVFTMEHPVFTAYGSQSWYCADDGQILHWPVDRYFIEGKREADFLGEKVVKYHHTLTTVLQQLLKNNFEIVDIAEPQPTQQMLQSIPFMKEELRRPMMLAVSAVKKR